MLSQWIVPAVLMQDAGDASSAQTQPTQTVPAQDRPSQPSDSGASAQRDIEANYFQQLMALSSLALLASRMAARRIVVPPIVNFAHLEIAQQTLIGDVFRSLHSQTLNMPSSTDAEIEKYLFPPGRQQLDKMRGETPGGEFTREYFLLAIATTQQLVKLHEEYLKLGTDPATVRAAKLADFMAREHLQLLSDIRARLTTGSAPSRRRS